MTRYHRVRAIRAAAVAAAPQATWPMAERLEPRLLLATVPGTGGNDQFHVRTHFEGDSEVFVNDSGMNDPPDFVIPAGSHIVIDAGDGDDTLTILTEDGIGFDALDFLGGGGDDELVIDAGEGGTFFTAGGNLIRLWVDIPIIHEGTETLTFHGPDTRFVADLNGVDLNLDIFQCTFGSDMHLNRLSLSATTNVYPDGVTGSLLVAKSIDMAAGARFELGPPSLLIDYDGTNTPLGTWGGSGYTGLLELIKADGLRPGFNEDLTVAAAEARDLFGLTASQTALWKGETVDSTTVLVRTTYAGDANLDGRINIDDYGPDRL